jgi:transposase InsO family protein
VFQLPSKADEGTPHSTNLIFKFYEHGNAKAAAEKLGVIQSMNRPKSMNDNAHMESFFHSLKSEDLAGRRFTSEDELLSAIRSYIPRYNAKRPHSSLGYLSPIDYERLAA